MFDNKRNILIVLDRVERDRTKGNRSYKVSFEVIEDVAGRNFKVGEDVYRGTIHNGQYPTELNSLAVLFAVRKYDLANSNIVIRVADKGYFHKWNRRKHRTSTFAKMVNEIVNHDSVLRDVQINREVYLNEVEREVSKIRAKSDEIILNDPKKTNQEKLYYVESKEQEYESLVELEKQKIDLLEKLVEIEEQKNIIQRGRF